MCDDVFLHLFHRGDDYKNHNKCISEDQKYGGKGYEAKANKGDVKQQLWIQVKCRRRVMINSLNIQTVCFCKCLFLYLKRIHEAMNKPGVSAKLKDVLRQVSTYDNVPRKKAKFQVSVFLYCIGQGV